MMSARAAVAAVVPAWAPWDEGDQVARHNGNAVRSRRSQILLDSLLAEWAQLSKSYADSDRGLVRTSHHLNPR